MSSQAERLKPYAIDVKSPVDPVDWFLAGKDDVRSSYYLEDVATEFHVQGLELDWACVTWDADMRFTPAGWENWSFKGNKWLRILKDARKDYQKNAYRVLLTRAPGYGAGGAGGGWRRSHPPAGVLQFHLRVPEADRFPGALIS